MAEVLQPSSATELADAVRSAPRVLAVGAGTKPRLSRVADDVVRLSTAKLRGIVEYEPSEFTFTALAGTPVREIAAALGERGQYLPFDPLLADAGAPRTIDFLSLDVEGAELEVLKGVDHQEYRFKFILVECRDLARMTEFLERHNYRQVDRFSEHDYLFASLP